MKNKQVVQATARKKRKNALVLNRAKHRSEPKLERTAPSILEKPTILIVCEGKNTEPSYFLQFKLTSAIIKAIGKGYNTLSLVNQAIELQQKGNYDQVWCVFDKDNSSDVSFNKAIKFAASKDFGIAYSNQAFEYWLILHFEDHQGGGMSRREYDATINAYIKPMGAYFDGNGNKYITKSFWEILNGIDELTGQFRRDIAIVRAKRNYDLFDHISPAKEESSTTVFRLVQEILKYI